MAESQNIHYLISLFILPLCPYENKYTEVRYHSPIREQHIHQGRNESDSTSQLAAGVIVHQLRYYR